MIRDRLDTTLSHQKSYAYSRWRALELEVGDLVYLKISRRKGLMRFGKKGKSSLKYIGPYGILQQVGNVAYELKLLNDLDSVHSVFRILMLKICLVDPAFIFHVERLGVDENLSYEEVTFEILDRQVKQVRNI